jgi:hypothetical protein
VVDSEEDDQKEEGLDKVGGNSGEQMAVQRKGMRKADSKGNEEDSESNLQLLKPVVFAFEF